MGIRLSHFALALGALAAGVVGTLFVADLNGRSIAPQGNRSLLAAAATSDWTTLSPKLIWAVSRAELAAQRRARAELAVWQERVMQRVDPAFLDWHFGYFKKRYEDAKWIWGRITQGAEQADRDYLEALANAIAEKVLPTAQVENEIALVAKSAAEEFRDELIAIMSEYRRESAEHVQLFDTRLQEVNLALVDADLRPMRVSLKALSSHTHESDAVLSLLQLQFMRGIKSTEPVVRAEIAAKSIAGVAAAAATAAQASSGAAKVLGASKAAAATLGITAAAVVVIAAVGGHEWWAHNEHVSEQRPQLRAQIEASLRDFTHTLVQKNGPLGAEFEGLTSQLTRAIRQQETAWGRFTSRMAQLLPR